MTATASTIHFKYPHHDENFALIYGAGDQKLGEIQNMLFEIGANLASEGEEASLNRIRPGIAKLEDWIDACEEQLEPLRNFVLPGGHRTAALLHVLRTVCRRAEREVWSLGSHEKVPVEIGIWRGLVAGLNAAAQVLLIQIFILVPVLILGLLPGINVVVIPLGIAISAYLNAIVWFEIPVLRRGYGMRYRRRVVKRNWARALGLGLAFNAGLLVPFFNILFLAPATAVAVSALYFRFEKRVLPN